MYNNNLFRLQIEELIKEVTIKNKRKKALQSWLNTFKSTLENLPEFDGVLLSNIKKIIKCRCTLKTDQDLTLKFKKPENVECFGLFETNSLAGPSLETSINLQIPKTCFQVKDFLNNRYLVKRFYYLMYIFENLSAQKKSITYHENNILLPILHVQPTEDDKLTVNIYATPAQDYFKPSRFLPNQNNVKQDLFEAKINDFDVLKATPTILYNNTMAHDVTLKENSDFIKATLKDHDNVQEGIKLLCIWLKQRELDSGFGAFTINLLVYLITYLLAKKKINKFMSSYQIIRNFWSFVCTTDLENHPISLGEANFELFNGSSGLVFLDKTGCYNLATFLDVNVFRKVKFECELAMKHLNDSRVESFHSLFLTKFPFAVQYDVLLE